MGKFKAWLNKEWEETKVLLRSIPASIMTMFCIALILMNLFANKQLVEVGNWLALDCGMLVSWLAFFTMDMVVRRFGPRASTKLTLVATAVNLFVCLIMVVIGSIPNNWGAAYLDDGSISSQVNTALDSTISGTWFVLLGSTVAFIASAIVHSFINWSIRKSMKENNSSKSYLVCSYVSTSVGQFVDNLIFALIVSLNFFGWNIVQCLTCALTGMVIELLFELIFAPAGYRITKRWEKYGIGNEYLKVVGEKDESIDNRDE